MKAIVRCVASSFAQAITMQSPATPISLQAAVQQQGRYVQLLKGILGKENVIELPADDKYPGNSSMHAMMAVPCMLAVKNILSSS